jgi:hypothetical protein
MPIAFFPQTSHNLNTPGDLKSLFPHLHLIFYFF